MNKRSAMWPTLDYPPRPTVQGTCVYPDPPFFPPTDAKNEENKSRKQSFSTEASVQVLRSSTGSAHRDGIELFVGRGAALAQFRCHMRMGCESKAAPGKQNLNFVLGSVAFFSFVLHSFPFSRLCLFPFIHTLLSLFLLHSTPHYNSTQLHSTPPHSPTLSTHITYHV